MQKEQLKFHDSCVFEGMTSIRAILKAMETGISDRRIEKILFDQEKISKISKEVGYLRAVSQKFGFCVLPSDAKTIDAFTLGSSHGGLIAFATERTIPFLEASLPRIKPGGFYCMIQGIEDPYNFGYSLRSLYACGCDGIILPERNWMTAAGVVARSSAGASELFPVYRASCTEAVDVFHKLGYRVVCAEEKTDLILGKCEIKLPVLLLVGGEKRGISRSVLSEADMLVKIVYGREFHASLSAASATTIFAYEIARQNFLPETKALT